MKKIIYIMLIIFILSFFLYNDDTYKIPKQSIRFRIIANSNSSIDQNTKYLIKKELETSLFPLLENSNSIEETRNIIKNNESLIDKTISKYNIPYNINYGQNYFPQKQYLGQTYEEGLYESLVISLGEGTGNNWWCVMYPPLCLLESKSEDMEEIEYKSYIHEIFNKLTK